MKVVVITEADSIGGDELYGIFYRCPECGNDVYEKYVFCPYCGLRIMWHGEKKEPEHGGKQEEQ